MNLKNAAVLVTTPLAVIGVVALSLTLSGGPAEVGKNGTQDQFSSAGLPAGRQPVDDGATTAANPAGFRAAEAADQACDPTATPSLAAKADARVRDALESNPASNADPSAPELTRSGAVAAARQLSVAAQEQPTGGTSAQSSELLPAAAAQGPFSEANKLFAGEAGDDSLVAPTRCVWIVTVQGPFKPRSAPLGATAPVFERYTAVFDSRSGQYLGVTAGTDSPDLLTGANLGDASK